MTSTTADRQTDSVLETVQGNNENEELLSLSSRLMFHNIWNPTGLTWATEDTLIWKPVRPVKPAQQTWYLTEPTVGVWGREGEVMVTGRWWTGAFMLFRCSQSPCLQKTSRQFVSNFWKLAKKMKHNKVNAVSFLCFVLGYKISSEDDAV